MFYVFFFFFLTHYAIIWFNNELTIEQIKFTDCDSYIYNKLNEIIKPIIKFFIYNKYTFINLHVSQSFVLHICLFQRVIKKKKITYLHSSESTPSSCSLLFIFKY